ncbi:unknown [Corallococcus sp. CAG:1435]|nr:unknown [Corallococcus sp. CAG:1435]
MKGSFTNVSLLNTAEDSKSALVMLNVYCSLPHLGMDSVCSVWLHPAKTKDSANTSNSISAVFFIFQNSVFDFPVNGKIFAVVYVL